MNEQNCNCYDHSLCARAIEELKKQAEDLRATLREREAELAEAKGIADTRWNLLVLERNKVSILVSTVARMRAEREDWQASVKAIMDTSCNQDEKHCTCVPLLRAKVDEINENYEDMITHRLELESTVARLREALEYVLKTLKANERGLSQAHFEFMGGDLVATIEKALSPSPSANSGEKPGITEQELKDRGYVDLTKLGGNDWRLQRYGECAACGGNLTADHQCHRRKSVSPGGIA